ncbi:hypothetical protein [Streptomyces sp. ME18-1-4]|uniref:hypothetical protein n=1 Tax=Streptomyces sp. ME18-1-4 TaxID=3028685 RepID=UPI0029BAE27F|nr:hypothetical protein [Streptomyces sp. ME18-1-4]MDX3247705.1 hypothetical protein [Streptomyces sp. ME18-1-4]
MPKIAALGAALGAAVGVLLAASAGVAAAGEDGGGGGFTTQQVEGPSVVVPPNSFGSADATCPAGTTLTGGGFGTISPALEVTGSYGAGPGGPGGPNTWRAVAVNTSQTNQTLTAFAICATLTGPPK